MKNIFSQFGSKKVAGAVLAGATLMVGLGVVNNFSGGSQKAANEAALANFGNSAYNSTVSGSSANRADLERQITATQGGYSARFLTGRSDGTEPGDAFSSDGAYTEGVRSGNVDYGAANGAYQPFGSTYEQSADGMEFADDPGSGYGEEQFQSVQDAAAAAANQGAKGARGKGGKGTKGQPSGAAGQMRPATQINKMTASKGGSNFGGGSGSGSRGGGLTSFASGGSNGGNDNNTVVLPQTGAGQADGNAFKFGRAGTMGGFNGGFSGGNEAKGGHSRGTGAASDLQMAVAYSGKAQATRQETGSKSLAEAAFDGSNPEDLAPTIPEGATIGKVTSSLMRGINMDMPDGSDLVSPNDIEPELEQTAELAAELAALQKKLTLYKWATAIGALVLSILIAIIKNIAGWGTIVAGIITAAAAVLLVIMTLKMKGIVDQMADPKFKTVNQGIDIGGKYASIGVLVGLSGLLVGAGWTNMWQNAWNNITSFFKGFKGARAAGDGVGKALKAGKEAAKTASEAAEGFRLKDFFNIKKWVEQIFSSGTKG